MSHPTAPTKTSRVAIVTGGARGIGRGIASRFARDGHRVVVWDLDPDVALEAGAEWKPEHVHRVDVANPASVEAALAETLEVVGHVDILVNNAGINGPVKPLVEYSPMEWQRVIDINLGGVFNTTRALTPHMVGRGWGRIVNVASIAGKEGVPNISPYSASKAGVIGLTKALSKELVTTGVTVNAVAPVMVATDLLHQMTDEHIASSKAKIPMQRLLEVDELAALVAWIASDECTFTTGFTFDASGGRATY
ncbi:SDR family NAD(P)-dependent oxidoreductase [Aeromicrobium sp. IC_218]|uniref:SDR family NAD(P)-dependent oxidoreductase n=1 Tax=Aeromicrobium sp. IC_218 TaxID=2545468 RepID=UPI00103DE358|nr:SDR family NAD(P)-dependent oxidoreductase [Aeromicrobium sp. IC_218]TCI96362.1 SDR family oxidoreductase [Aeromicrobium sp. IC_218]